MQMSLPPGGLFGGGVGLALFSLIWNLLVWYKLVESQGGLVLLLSIPVFIGIAIAVLAFQLLIGTFTLQLNPITCVGTWKLFGLSYSKYRRTIDILDVVESAIYEKGGQPKRGVGIKFSAAEDLEFGSTLTEDERKWVVGELRHHFKILRESMDSKTAS